MPLAIVPPQMTVDPTTKAGQLSLVLAQIAQIVPSAGGSILNAYRNLRRLVYAAPNGRDGKPLYTSDDVYGAMDPADAEKLGNLAVIAKTIVNTLQPGLVVDPVPSGVLVLPTDPKFALLQAVYAATPAQVTAIQAVLTPAA